MTTTPGIDVSHHQGKIDWQKVADAGYRFAIIRASYGAKTVDSRFVENWDGAKAAGLLVSSYHFMLPALLGDPPNQPSNDSPETVARLQADHFFGVLDGRKADFPLCLDVEIDVLKYTDAAGKSATHRVPQDVITKIVREFLRLIKEKDGRDAILYTSRSKWNRYVERSSEWAGYDLWVANYVNDITATTPGVPDDWTTWKIWQHSEGGKVSGIPANTTDLNVFNGSAAELQQWAASVGSSAGTGSTATGGTGTSTGGSGTSSTGGSTGTGGSTTRTGLQAQVSVTSLNVRGGPGVQFSKVDTLKQGNVITAQAVGGSSIWVEFAPDQWAAAVLNNRQYLTISAAADGSLQAKVAVPTLNVRKGPGTGFDTAGKLNQDDVVTIHDLAGGDVWLEYETGKWAALIFNGQRFMSVVA
ncbi:MAG: hypothetical protein H6672_13975 [Anaerolineaceae bacterium]|nr:hypothetical protein [Anaerolineaceae bacterium]